MDLLAAMDALREKHVLAKTWDSGNPEAVMGWVTWCAGCGQRPWPCDTRVALDAIHEMNAVGPIEHIEAQCASPQHDCTCGCAICENHDSERRFGEAMRGIHL
jgi:hypothetical protein